MPLTGTYRSRHVKPSGKILLFWAATWQVTKQGVTRRKMKRFYYGDGIRDEEEARTAAESARIAVASVIKPKHGGKR